MSFVVPDGLMSMARRYEGLAKKVTIDGATRFVPYLCPAGHWTIGYGHLCSKDHPPITLSQAVAYLIEDIEDAVAWALKHCPVLADEPERRLTAVADFVFNLGQGRLKASTLRTRVNQRDWPAAAEEMRRWVWGGGKKLPGLILRREEAAKLLLMG
jgi:lysozyme